MTKALFGLILATIGMMSIEILVSGFTLGTPPERMQRRNYAAEDAVAACSNCEEYASVAAAPATCQDDAADRIDESSPHLRQ